MLCSSFPLPEALLLLLCSMAQAIPQSQSYNPTESGRSAALVQSLGTSLPTALVHSFSTSVPTVQSTGQLTTTSPGHRQIDIPAASASPATFDHGASLLTATAPLIQEGLDVNVNFQARNGEATQKHLGIIYGLSIVTQMEQSATVPENYELSPAIPGFAAIRFQNYQRRCTMGQLAQALYLVMQRDSTVGRLPTSFTVALNGAALGAGTLTYSAARLETRLGVGTPSNSSTLQTRQGEDGDLLDTPATITTRLTTKYGFGYEEPTVEVDKFATLILIAKAMLSIGQSYHYDASYGSASQTYYADSENIQIKIQPQPLQRAGHYLRASDAVEALWYLTKLVAVPSKASACFVSVRKVDPTQSQDQPLLVALVDLGRVLPGSNNRLSNIATS